MTGTNSIAGTIKSTVDGFLGKGTTDAVANALGLDGLLAGPSKLDRFGTPPGSSYTVKRGDTLSGIAAAHGTDVKTLARINGISNPNKIGAGQAIRLPAGSSASYTVKAGDTLSKIAAANGTTVAALKAANPQIKNANRIFPGDVIRIGGPLAPKVATPTAKKAPTQAVPDAPVSANPAAPATTGVITPGKASIKAADLAEQRAGPKSKRECYAWVKRALQDSGAVSRYLVGVPAKGAGPELVKEGYVNVLGKPGYNIKSPYDAPKGAVLVYGAAPGANDGAAKWGHIEIRTGSGFASDYKSPRARTGPAENGLSGRGRVLIGVYIKPDASAKPVQVPAAASKSPAAGPVPAAGKNDLIARLGKVITIGEGNYESYNAGTVSDPKGRVTHSFINPPAGTITNKTIDQILATESKSSFDKGRLFATGKYQTTIPTLREAKAALKLTGNEKYTPELQERIFRDFLLQKAGGGKLAAFVKDGKGTLEGAQYAASKEWASIAVPAGFKNKYGIVSDGTLSYYQKAGQNSASMKATNELRALLTEIQNSRR